ncbi:MAG TPA: farnesyl diphosphate synthase [Methylotenera sp.]|jgi:farnesyl diphosphate synthase|nr:farnesyl diphosphate synthase [Methylotenera sp.]
MNQPMTQPINEQTSAFNAWAQNKQTRMEDVLNTHLPSASTSPMRLHEAMRYATMGGGKRVRALLAYAAGEFCGADLNKIDVPAAAVEIIHAFSLVHDDLPCMDNDDLRRGKPTTHKQYGDALALLVGDALQSLAFQLISQDKQLKSATQKLKMLHILALASGSRGMAGGQAIDIESIGIPLSRPELEHMHIQKTGALIRAGALLGAYSADKPKDDKIKAVDHFAKSIGLAFQVVDDILDAEANTQTLGKTAGKDQLHNKSTYVTILGLSAAKQLASELHANAMAALSFYGREADLLRHLANFITHRSY